jgi:hypothetical protein
MNTKELKPGNVVYLSEYGIIKMEPLTAYQIYQLEIKSNGGQVAGYYNTFAPVLLDESLLLKLGAQPATRSPFIDKRAWEWGEDMSRIVWCANRLFKYISATDLICISDWGYEIDSLHRLQNAFAGLGIELTTLDLNPTNR